MNTIAQQVVKARNVSTPIIGIETPDPAATQANVSEAVQKEAEDSDEPPVPMMRWDIINGLVGMNQPGMGVVANLCGDMDPLSATGNPAECLSLLAKMDGVPERSIIFFHNAPLFYNQQGGEAVIQGIWNIRDLYKQDFRTLFLLGSDMDLPATIAQDVIVFREDLPDDDELRTIITNVHEDAREADPSLKTLKKDQIQRGVESLRGLAAYPAEQTTAMSLIPKGIDVGAMWERKRIMIEQTKGLTFLRSQFRFADSGGIENSKEFATRLFNGNRPPTCNVFIDEIEKMFAGASGGATDTSGVSQDQLGVMLTEMQTNNWTGMILVGHPGTGKSFLAETIGAEFDVPVLRCDLGATKGSLVGQSEQQIRAMMRTIKGVAGEDAFFIATCNRLESLPPELRRRFTFGIWFFDLPTKEERESIWQICLKRYKLNPKAKRPIDEGWTGAEIKNVCDLAWRLNCDPAEAAQFIVPICESDPQSIDRLRNLANNNFLSASVPGKYILPSTAAAQNSGRKKRSVRVSSK